MDNPTSLPPQPFLVIIQLGLRKVCELYAPFVFTYSPTMQMHPALESLLSFHIHFFFSNLLLISTQAYLIANHYTQSGSFSSLR